MANRTKKSVLGHAQLEQKKELQLSDGLPFRRLLSEDRVSAALTRAGVEFRDRIYPPKVTLWAWLSQVTADKDASCTDAVGRVIADRVAHHQVPCSPDSSSYCTARGRLPEQVIIDLAQETGQELHRQAKSEWLWKDRRVVIVDGSTVTMADTEENQAEYPQSSTQKAGLGFPILRFVVLLSLSVGTVLNCAIGACRGKKTGEQSLFRRICNTLQHGEILLGDRLYDAYRDIVLLKGRGIDVVFGKKQSRNCDFRSGRRLGKNDHVTTWKRPRYDASRYESKAEWEALPEDIEIREVRVTVRRKGYRTRVVVVVTTLLDGEQYSAEDLTDLFRERWHIELDLRSIKRSLGMHHLSSQSPEMVRKELWMHLFSYNLIRVRMAQAAALYGLMPRTLSFIAAKTLMDSFAPHLNVTSGAEYHRLEAELLRAIARSPVKKRPGRVEPRAVKKRVQKYSYLTKPRTQARKQVAA